jgi:hypothetical protein
MFWFVPGIGYSWFSNYLVRLGSAFVSRKGAITRTMWLFEPVNIRCAYDLFHADMKCT